MTQTRSMRFILGAAALIGLLLVIAFVVVEGFPTIMQILATARWGIITVTLLHLSTVLLCAGAWGALMSPTWRGPLYALFLFRWVREGVNSLLPVAQVGGIFVQARLLTLRGVTSDLAGASSVVDLTLEVTTLFLFSLLGLGLLTVGRPAQPSAPLVLGVALGFTGILGFYATQRLGLVRPLARLSGRLAQRAGWRSPDSLLALDSAIQALYRNRRQLAAGAALHFTAWLVSAVEIGVLLCFMDQAVGVRRAMIVASLGYAVRAAGFLVPGALGIQEGGFMLLATLVGIPAPIGLALSLARRVRELLLGVPALLAWQLIEGRRFWTQLDKPHA